MDTINTPQPSDKSPKPEVNRETVNQIVEYMREGGGFVFGPNTMDIMESLAHETDSATLNSLSRDDQRSLFMRLAEDDPYETLNHSHLYQDKPYGMEVLEKAALADTETAISMIEKHPDNQKIQKLDQILRRKLGKEKVHELKKGREIGLFRWLTEKLFGDEEKEEAERGTRKKDVRGSNG